MHEKQIIVCVSTRGRQIQVNKEIIILIYLVHRKGFMSTSLIKTKYYEEIVPPTPPPKYLLRVVTVISQLA